MILVYVTMVFTCFNIIMSAYMAYLAIVLQRVCPCLKYDINWYIILVYFGISVVFIAYAGMYMRNRNRGRLFLILVLIYSMATIVFLLSAFIFTGKLKVTFKYQNQKQECPCEETKFKKLLFIVTIVRVIMVISTIFIAVAWFLTNPTVSLRNIIMSPQIKR